MIEFGFTPCPYHVINWIGDSKIDTTIAIAGSGVVKQVVIMVFDCAEADIQTIEHFNKLMEIIGIDN